MNVLDLVRSSGQQPRRKADGGRGQEWCSPCPGCGGTDRFLVWPEQHGGDGSYYCRGCGLAGDAIQFLRDFRGMGFREACDYLGKDVPECEHEHTPRRPAPKTQGPVTVARKSLPQAAWREHADKFVAACAAALREQDLEYLAGRGIPPEVAREHRLGWHEGERNGCSYRARAAWGLPEKLNSKGKPRPLWIPRGLVIPVERGGQLARVKIRQPKPQDPAKKYHAITGSTAAPMALNPQARAFVVVEAELDALAVHAAAGDLVCAVALGSLTIKPDPKLFEAMRNGLRVLDALDFGDKGPADKHGRASREWWERALPEQYRRWPVPEGKDPGEAVELGLDLREWILAGLPPAVTLGLSDAGRVSAEGCGGGGAVERSQVPEPVSRLADIMRRHPIYIRKTETGVSIIDTVGRMKAPGRVFRAVSDLVFGEARVWDWLVDLPDGNITGRNILDRGPDGRGSHD